MQRRKFVRAGLLGATASGLGACRPSDGSAAPALTEAEVEAATEVQLASQLARLDGGMGHIACSPITVRDLNRRAANRHVECKKDPLDEQLVRSSLRALLLTGSIKDLPEREQGRPEVAERLAAASPEVDFAVYGMTEQLSALSVTELAEIQELLRTDPKAAPRVAEMLAEEATAAGIPLRRRLHFRRLVNHVLWRLEHQPASLLLDEYTRKVRRNTAQIERQLQRDPGRHGSLVADPEEVARWEAQTLRVVARHQPEAAACVATGSGLNIEEQRERARLLLRNGGIVVGVGVGVAALGVGLLFVGAGVFVLTAAGILLISGIIIMIVAAVRRKRLAQ